MSKIARTFRLDKEVVDRILTLQEFYSKQLNVNVSQADVIKILVNNEFESLDKSKGIN